MKQFFLTLIIAPCIVLSNPSSFIRETLDQSLNYNADNFEKHSQMIQPMFTNRGFNEIRMQLNVKPSSLVVRYKPLAAAKIIQRNADGSYQASLPIQLTEVTPLVTIHHFNHVSVSVVPSDKGDQIDSLTMQETRDPIVINHSENRFRNCPQNS